MSFQLLKTLLGGNAEATLAVVDQKTGLRRARRVDLVCFVCLADFVHLVSFVQPKNQTNETNQITVLFGWRAFSAS
jgi:hypothetical protein